METYIEYVIIDNMVIDSLILTLTSKFNNLEVKFYKILLISLLGTIIAIISPFVQGVYQIIVKLSLGCLMPILLSKQKTFKKYIITILTFYLTTMVMGGACLLICELFKIKYVATDGVIAIYNFPVGLALLITTAIYFVIKNILINFNTNKKFDKFVYQIILKDNENEQKTTAFLDSGNMLIDDKNNKPITLINFEIFNKLFPEIKLSDILLKKYDRIKLKNLREFEIKTLTKSSKILLFEIDNIDIVEINKNYQNALIGLSLKDFNFKVDANCILSPLMFEIGE